MGYISKGQVVITLMISLGCPNLATASLISVILVVTISGCSPSGDSQKRMVVAKAPEGNVKHHEVHILKPEQPRVLTGELKADGSTESVSCGTCHSTKEPNLALASSAGLKEFHTGMKFSHGNLSCLSCHNATNYDELKLADGRGVSFPDVMTLCAQCHGPQHRDFQRGSHGGMTGYWDLTKGPRTRNHCVTCMTRTPPPTRK